MHTNLKPTHQTVATLLARAAQDTDAVSVFPNGTCWGDTDSCIFVVKGGLRAYALYEQFCDQGLVTPGKPVVGPEPWTRDDERTFVLINLCGGHEVPRLAVTGWTDAQCQEAEDWAAAEHLAASDNEGVERRSMPLHVMAHPPKPRGGAGNLWDN